MGIIMTKETIYYNRMFGHKKLPYELETSTLKTTDKKITTYYYAVFDGKRLEIDKEEYECLLRELELL